MAHNIWSKRFYGHERGGWHGLGVVNDKKQSAVETLYLLGEYNVETVPLKFRVGDEELSSGFSVIVRHPTADDPQIRIFGDPVKEYELITPRMAANLWDTKLGTKGAHVETMAFLGKGENMFITTPLPNFNVVGVDEMRNFLVYMNPMHAGEGAGVYLTSIRTVCENTLRTGIAAASARYTIPHTPGAVELLGNWMADRYDHALMMLDTLREAYDLLAKTPVTEKQVREIAVEVYPLPEKPDPDRPRIRPYDEVAGYWERDCETAKRYREAALNLFKGEGRGLDTTELASIAGTAWAGLNAFAEVESFRRGATNAVAVSLVNGDRAGRVMSAYNHFMQIAIPATTKNRGKVAKSK